MTLILIFCIILFASLVACLIGLSSVIRERGDRIKHLLLIAREAMDDNEALLRENASLIIELAEAQKSSKP